MGGDERAHRTYCTAHCIRFASSTDEIYVDRLAVCATDGFPVHRAGSNGGGLIAGPVALPNTHEDTRPASAKVFRLRAAVSSGACT